MFDWELSVEVLAEKVELLETDPPTKSRNRDEIPYLYVQFLLCAVCRRLRDSAGASGIRLRYSRVYSLYTIITYKFRPHLIHRGSIICSLVFRSDSHSGVRCECEGGGGMGSDP